METGIVDITLLLLSTVSLALCFLVYLYCCLWFLFYSFPLEDRQYDTSKRLPKSAVDPLSGTLCSFTNLCFAEIGIGLSGFGVVFLFLGTVLFFDRGLLAMGNVRSARAHWVLCLSCCLSIDFVHYRRGFCNWDGENV